MTITTTPPNAKRGITVYATPLGDGTLSMTESVRFDHPQLQLRLSPPKVKDAPAVFKHLVPTVSQIELTVDGHDMQIASHTLIAPLVVMLTAPALRVDVRYLLDHVVQDGPGGTTATSALVAPLIDGASDALNVSYVIGSQINSYGCPQLSTSTARADCQALARTSTSPVGLISGLPSATALLVIGLPPGTAIPSPSDSPPSSGPPKSAPPPPPAPSPSSPPPAPSAPPSPTPPPATPTTPVPTATPPPTGTSTVPPAPPTPTSTPTPTPTPTPTETATTPPPTGGAGATGGNATNPPAAPAAVDPVASGAAASGAVSGSASQAGSQVKAAVPNPETVPAVVTAPTGPAA